MHCIRLGLTIQWPIEYRGFDPWVNFKKNKVVVWFKLGQQIVVFYNYVIRTKCCCDTIM